MRKWLPIYLFLLLGIGASAALPYRAAEAVTAETWKFELPGLVGGGMSCAIRGASLELVRQGTALEGSYGDGELTCTDSTGRPKDLGPAEGMLVNGKVEGSRISFDIDSPDAHQTGTITAHSMSGTATWVLDFGSRGVIELTGPWHAMR